jgi:protein subunit release factor B
MAEIVVPEDATEERFLAGSGPGGQNVNRGKS